MEQAEVYEPNMIEKIEQEFEVLGDVPAEPGRFQITTRDQAAWALRKMAKFKAEQVEIHHTAHVEYQRIQDWENAEVGKLQRSLDFFTFLLESFFLSQRTDDPALKHIKLPHGTIQARKQQPEYEYIEERILPWAKEILPEAVVVKETTNKNTVKTWMKENPDKNVPGVTVTERPEKIYVEVV